MLIRLTKKWDTCASEALLMSLGGILTTLRGDSYKYNGNKENFNNNEGILASL